MTLISMCTVLCILIFFMGTNRQYVVESPIDGFNGKWKFNVDKKIVILFAIVLICVSTMRLFHQTYDKEVPVIYSLYNLSHIT